MQQIKRKRELQNEKEQLSVAIDMMIWNNRQDKID